MAMAADQISWVGPHVIVPIRAEEKTPHVIRTTMTTLHAAQQARIKEVFLGENLSSPKPNILAAVYDLAHGNRQP
jgi:hypothetical protein